nr:uncharacterized protein LOC121503206 [Drosophila kikkawai]
MLSAESIALIKKQVEITERSRELVKLPSFSVESIREYEKLKSECVSNHSSLLRIGVVDHDYFKNKHFDEMMSGFKTIKEKIEEVFKKAEEEAEKKTEQKKIDLALEQLESYLQDTLLAIQEDKVKTFDIRIKKINFYWDRLINLKEVTHVDVTDRAYDSRFDEIEFDIAILISDMKKKTQEVVPIKVDVANLKIDDLPTLPKIQVPAFFGDSKDWDLFYELFTELIHLREDLSPTLKFNYLKISVKGEARNVVSHLLLGSGENYEAAWELLTKRYENKRKIFSEQLNRLLELENVNLDSTRQLRMFIRAEPLLTF